MGETHLPDACWIMVALTAAFTVWMCLSVLGAAVQYERNRRKLAGEVRELRKRYSMSFRDVIMPDDVVSAIGSDRRAA